MAGELLTTQDAEQAAPAHTPSYKRLTRDDLTILRAMHKAGKPQTEIAQALGCTQGTISKWLPTLTDTRDAAKEFFDASALRMAQNIVKKGRAADHIKVLEGREVLAPQDVRGGLTIVIGSGSTVQVNVGVDGLSPPGIASGGEGVENH